MVSSTAAEVAEPAIPHVSQKAKDSYSQVYKYEEDYRAYAIGPGGAWSWSSGALSVEDAEFSAIHRCNAYSKYGCTLYASGDSVVLDHNKWKTMWRPYPTAEQARQADIGKAMGNKMYDLLLAKDGKPIALSSLQGKVVLLHFWGSWCPPCCKELPELQKLYDVAQQQQLAVEVVLTQVRESYTTSSSWMLEQNLTMPLYDSGAVPDDGGNLHLNNGGMIKDRLLAKVFPATYILDKNGIVIFSHVGPIENWLEYLPFLEDLVGHNSK